MAPALLLLAVLLVATPAAAESTGIPATLDEAHRLFFSGRYDSAAALALAARQARPDNLSAIELRSSALHFQIRRMLGPARDRDAAWKACDSCPELMTAFLAETNLGRNAARERLNRNASDRDALFYLGKLNLNYVWMQLQTRGKKSGWSEYWEARKSLDALLKSNPEHVRGRVARAWIDYIVDTKVPRGTKWLLGGGDRKRALQNVIAASQGGTTPVEQAEAQFALWEMQQRENNLPEAIAMARVLSREFPENRDLARFLSEHDLQTRR